MASNISLKTLLLNTDPTPTDDCCDSNCCSEESSDSDCCESNCCS